MRECANCTTLFTPRACNEKKQKWCSGRCKARDKRLRNLYGIGAEEYNDMLERQRGRCALCGNKLGAITFVDHDHMNGEVRGILHPRCNSVIGFADDNPILLRMAINYLELACAY